MPASTTRSSLDSDVHSAQRALSEAGVPKPRVVFLMATGSSALQEALTQTTEFELADVPGVPALWQREWLHAGHLGELPVWLFDDVSGDPLEPEPQAAWTRAFPVWLAAKAGARVGVHTSAGCALRPESGASEGEPSGRSLRPGSFAFARDHVNLSGRTPLLGLGPSELGPLFPDQSLLHHLGLRHSALERADALGLQAAEAVVACTAGPALETPAERRLYARAGADVAVQSLATPLIAAAHAGIAMLSIITVTDAGDGPSDVGELVRLASVTEPALADLLAVLSDDLAAAADVLDEEERR